MMEGGALQATMRVLFLTTLALIPVLAAHTRSPQYIPVLDIGSVAFGLVERMGPSATAAKLEYCNRRCADVNRQLAVQRGRDLTTLSSEPKTILSSASLRVEVEALISFKEAVTKDFLGALSSWNPNDLSACHWKGVTCDLSSKRVIALELGHLQLVGSISPLLDRLQYLQNLDLSGNIFSGEIPPSLHNCSTLSHLTLRDNNLTGQIPSQLGELLNLKYLDLSGNYFLGGRFPASLGNCSQLRSLLLNFTNVEGAIPYTVGQLTYLEVLNVSATALSEAIPRSLGNCSSLTQLLVGNSYALPLFHTGTMHTTGLSGELPMEIGTLTRLTVFEIRGSEIGGRFPNWIANLTRLTDLTLSRCSLNGEIPQFLGKLPLERFTIEYNNFTGDFPTSLLNCSDLTLLVLSRNIFVGAIPPEIGLLNKLSTLRLPGNSFSGKIPSSLANCSSMTDLELGNSPTTFQAQSFPSWLTSLVNLIFLSLPSTNIVGVIPGDIGKLSKLQVLLLWGNSLTGPIPATIGNCSLLQALELDQNELSGELPTEIWLLSQMQLFLLGYNSLSGTIPPSIGNLSQVTLLYCNDNHFNGAIPVELGLMKNLLDLAMDYNGFSGNIPPSLGNTSLAALYMSGNQLIGSIPTTISNLTGLQALYLLGNRLQGSIPGDLMRSWTQLTDLVLDGNSLSGNIPEDIGNLKSLQILYLNNNELSGVVPDSLGRCINLLQVDLSFNSFYGIIRPVIIAQLSGSLNSLNLSHNRLSGSLPQELAELTVVTYLDFSANNFSGSIPSGLAECVALSSVDLSNNNLSGSIPQTLIQLKNLAYFNVSDNNLEGPIPDGGIFATSNVTPASFFGNDGLCGSILGRTCADVTPSRFAATSACKGFHCASIRIAVGCGAAGLSSVVLLLIWWFFFRKGELNGTKAEEVVTTFESGLRMSKEDLVNIMARSENVIGVGGISTVYKGVLGGDRIVAIKTLSIMADNSNHYKQVEADLLREAHVLSKLRHRNVMKVLGCFRSDEMVALISEFMPRGSLYDQLYETSDDVVQRCDLNWDARLHIAVGVAHGLVYLHNQTHKPMIHRDVKPSNIFLDETLEPKLGDFGVSRFVNPERDGEKTASTLCGTTGYIPPEYGTTTTVSTKGDIYSYGVVVLELLTRRHPILAEGGESGECGHIVDWVLESFEEQPIALLDASLIVDPMVNKENQIEQMKLLMRVGLLCTREKPESRPHMTDVSGMLNQIIERQSDRVCLPSVAELAHNITVWNTPEDPTSSNSMSS